MVAHASSSIAQKIQRLEPLQKKLIKTKTAEERYTLCLEQPVVQDFLSERPRFLEELSFSSGEVKAAVAALLAVGQGEWVFHDAEKMDHIHDRLNELFSVLVEVDQFYNDIGGIVGYQLMVLKLIEETGTAASKKKNTIHYLHPEGADLRKKDAAMRQFVRYGIENMDLLGEIYPVGGAGERLDLKDENTQEPLPVAALQFNGRTLLEGLVRDLQGREFLHYKLTGEQLATPIALMTSHEKNNQFFIKRIFENKKWFGRRKEDYSFFVQPLVPVVTIEGEWAMHAPLKLKLKPGGHGVIWKLAQEKGVFQWFADKKRTKALLRQINNPVAGTDNGLLGFTGIGLLKNKDFGFASCPRLLNTSEGVDIVLETEKEGKFHYQLTNIEYTQFAERGIQDTPEHVNSKYSKYPANTNVLFCDLKAVEKTLKKCAIPGLIINMKSTVPVLDHEGHLVQVKAGRLESTMQNIADYMDTVFDHQLKAGELEKIKTFVTYNERRKTISVTKNSYSKEKPIVETPEGCYYEYLQNSHDLFTNSCGMKLPALFPEEEYILRGPSFVMDFHPALGPLWEIIGQKIKGGSLKEKGELRLEIAELEMENVAIEGSLLIEAKDPMGEVNAELLRYNENNGKCRLKNVTVKNQGIDFQAPNHYWKNRIQRKENFTIIIEGNGEFYAENVTIEGNHHVVVPSGYKVTALNKNGKLVFEKAKIEKPTWHWDYSFDEGNNVKLRLVE